MNVNGRHFRTIWENDAGIVEVIDQRHLPHKFVTEELHTVDDFANAIADMHVRGAGLIGAAAGYGMYIAALHAPDDHFESHLQDAVGKLKATRPTAVNLAVAVDRQTQAIASADSLGAKRQAALDTARQIADEDAQACRQIGEHGLALLETISQQKNRDTLHILTHCNAGWLAFVDYGSATAPIYAAHDAGIDLHVWVDETRPRNQGASLTAWELANHGVPHTLIADNTGGHLMQHGMVDAVLVGSDRTTCTGDVANKIGTYLKALAAHDNGVPFYVALPSSTIDWSITDGVKNIPIEQRDGDEVLYIQGMAQGTLQTVRLAPAQTQAANYGFDVTPARLVTQFITEHGVCAADETQLLIMCADAYKKHTLRTIHVINSGL